MKKKSKIVIIVIAAIVVAAISLFGYDYSQRESIADFKIGEVYSTCPKFHLFKDYDNRYIELKKDGTYTYIDDASDVESDPDDPEPDTTYPRIDYVEGTYEQSGSDYILSPKKMVVVCFDDIKKAKNFEIRKREASFVVTEKSIDSGYYNEIKFNIYEDKEGKYILGWPGGKGERYSKDGMQFKLFNSDKTDLPDSEEEFFDLFTVIEE